MDFVNSIYYKIAFNLQFGMVIALYIQLISDRF